MVDDIEGTAVTTLSNETTAYGAILRAVSLALAAALVLILFFSPWLFGGEEMLVQVIMPVMALGLAGAVAHGLGYRPRSQILATVLGPWVAWPLMLSSLALLAFRVG